jgi:hypothetical protein
MSERQWKQARDAGASARRAGKPREKCPMYGMGEGGRTLREAWHLGWDHEDARRKVA